MERSQTNNFKNNRLARNLADRRLLQQNLPTSDIRIAAKQQPYSITSSAVARRCRRIADGLNTITLRRGIGTSLPVFGFLPIRGPFVRTTKDPNEESFTVSPCSRLSVISSSTIPTNAADSDRDKPVCR